MPRQLKVITYFQAYFDVADASMVEYMDGEFDAIFSRDTILHIEKKNELFKKFHVRWIDEFDYGFFLTFELLSTV